MNAIDIGYWQLALALVFVLAAGLSSLFLQLDLHRDIFWGTVRTVGQLFLMGYLLRYIFQIHSPWLVLLIFVGMSLFAARIISRRTRNKSVPYQLPTTVSMLLSNLVVTIVITAVIIQVNPWYEPTFFIPLGGMVVGNSMNAIALTLERLFGDLKKQRDLVEMYLSLGADYREASVLILRQAVSAGMIPAINSMMGVGIVSLPGMMTGQIIAGADPVVSIKYQILVILMLVGSTALGSVLVAYWVRRRCFSSDHRLLVL